MEVLKEQLQLVLSMNMNLQIFTQILFVSSSSELTRLNSVKLGLRVPKN